MREVGDFFGVGTTFVDKVFALHRASQDLVPRPHGGGYPARLLLRHEHLLRAEVQRRKDATLEDLRAYLEAGAELSVSASTVSRVLSRLDLPRKKKVWRRASVTTTSEAGSAAGRAGSTNGGSSSWTRRLSTPR